MPTPVNRESLNKSLDNKKGEQVNQKTLLPKIKKNHIPKSKRIRL